MTVYCLAWFWPNGDLERTTLYDVANVVYLAQEATSWGCYAISVERDGARLLGTSA